ncbi:hypothetical protein PYK79_31755 [Streptomyces sp. ID05-04B]|uniref:hypothetical protein n=1 Tax=Streptomyces sp. ID05-04B TaxID=3028661 RepID=UPI0029C247E7|nr:hypothetical protein [Streptomyces sp. ID05-04B]MDX5566909.1 hypothetical protein [Streptomyces sp. ID05-04B]
MATTDDYGQGVSISALLDQPNAETLAKNIANGIASRSVMRFASATARGATLTVPVEGMVTYLQDVDRLYVYAGTAWVEVGTKAEASAVLTSGTSQTSSEILTGLSVTLPTKASTSYKLTVTGLVRSTLANDRVDLLVRRGTTTSGTQIGGGILLSNQASTAESLTAIGYDTPGAGTTTWVVTLNGVGSGLCDLTASAAFPAVFTVKEI